MWHPQHAAAVVDISACSTATSDLRPGRCPCCMEYVDYANLTSHVRVQVGYGGLHSLAICQHQPVPAGSWQHAEYGQALDTPFSSSPRLGKGHCHAWFKLSQSTLKGSYWAWM
jgi:hypothetical protein